MNMARDSRGHYTAKANPPRLSRDGLLSRPKFPPRGAQINESSTSEVSASPLRNESLCDTKNCPSSESSSSVAVGSNGPLWEVPIHLEPAIYRTESAESSHTSCAGNKNHFHHVSWEERSPTAPLGWVGKRAYEYQVRLALQE